MLIPGCTVRMGFHVDVSTPTDNFNMHLLHVERVVLLSCKPTRQTKQPHNPGTNSFLDEINDNNQFL